MARILKSVLWLVGCGGLGYSLFVLCTPDDSYLAPHVPKGHPKELEERKNKRAAFLEALQTAAETDEPLYRKARGRFTPGN
ncbi:uncharacterized protein LOC113384658 [Ctenocephalides felis]|uniref:uncharacterized protein LOC113384658 n=1 Tax=Ctenocephalides felis TaxID=7515 RepID=UPI000E6E1CC0|nr:uncharacterized protein LOC113384658 [Ctenocephalides felis]